MFLKGYFQPKCVCKLTFTHAHILQCELAACIHHDIMVLHLKHINLMYDRSLVAQISQFFHQITKDLKKIFLNSVKLQYFENLYFG